MVIDKPGMEWQVYAWGYHDGRTGSMNRIDSFAGEYRQVYEYGFCRGEEDRQLLGEYIPRV